METKKSSVKMNVGYSPWFSCKGILSKPKKYSVNKNLKIANHFVNGMWSETVVDKLLDALAAQHLALEDAHAELDAERDASAVGIQHALSMISQLQQEKSSLAQEHTSYYRETEIRLAIAQKKFSYYEDLLEEKNEEIRILQDEIRAYRSEEENDDRDVDFSSASHLSNAPFDKSDTPNEADIGDLVENDLYNRCLPGRDCDRGLCSRNFVVDCLQFNAQRSCSENNPLSENLDNCNNRNVAVHKDAQPNDICREPNNAESSDSESLYEYSDDTHFGDLQHEQKCVSEQLEDALVTYICALKEGTKEQRSDSFSHFYRTVHEAAREEHIPKYLNSYHSRNIPSWGHAHDWFCETCMTEKSFLDNKIADSPLGLRIKELRMRICALENNNSSIERGISFFKQKQNQMGPRACNTHNDILRWLAILTGLMASSVKGMFSKASKALWGVCLFLFIGSQKSSKRS